MGRSKMMLLGVCVFAIAMASQFVGQDFPLWLRALGAGAAAGLVMAAFLAHELRRKPSE